MRKGKPQEVWIIMKEVCLGTIGSGPIVHHILDNVQKVEGVSLKAVYSRTIERARQLADEYGCTNVYTSLEKMLADETVNTVYVASPNILHYEQAKQALLAGKHVWCEKPFTTTLAQAEELISIAEEKGLYLIEAAPPMFVPNFKLLKMYLPKVGRVRLVLGSYSQYSSRYDNLKNGELPNIFNPEMGGGCLMDINFYNVLLCCALFGKPDEATYTANIFPGVGCDTSGVAVLKYPDFTAVCSGAKDTWGTNAFQIQGEEGFIRIDGGSNGLAEIALGTKEETKVYSHQPDPDRWYYEVEELTRLFLEDAKDEIDGRHEIIRNTVDTMCRLRASAGIRFPGDPE